MRPLLKPALRPLWRAEQTLQLGLDPDLAVVLDGVGPAEVRFITALDGTRTRDEVLRDADAGGRDAGPDPATAERLLDLLAAGGALDDAAAPLRPLSTLAPDVREGLAADLASWSLAHPAPGAAGRTLARRHAAVVAVHGSGRVGAAVAPLLDAAGVGRVVTVPAGEAAGDGVVGGRAGGRRPDVAVLCDDSDLEPERRARMLADGVTHLAAAVRETVGLVGPLVVPGVTGCLRCLDLHRADRDPAWPMLAAQLWHPGPHARRRTTPPACDAVLAAAVAAHAALAVLAHVDDPAAAPVLADATLELRLPDAVPRRRSWLAHPACGCSWAEPADDV